MMNEKKKILIIEDSQTQALRLRDMLLKHNFLVDVACNGLEGLALIKDKENAPTLIIIDIIMPMMDGYEFVKSIKSDEYLKNIPIILLTGLSSPKNIIKILECGANNFITKPYKEDFFIAKINEILINQELGKSKNLQKGTDIYFSGKKHYISSDYMQILDLLFSSYENAVLKNAELEKANQELISIQDKFKKTKLQAKRAIDAKSSFLTHMTHELRTPMNGIIGMVDLLLNKELHPKQSEYIKIIQKSSNALLTIINDILDFSKIEAGRMELEILAFNLIAEVNSVIKFFKIEALNKNLDLTCSIDPAIPSILMGDPRRLGQILINFIGNAIKFTTKGKIIVKLFIEEQTKTHVTVRFSVSDTGIGISEEDIGLLFKSFSQVESSITRKYMGTGLGLAIAKQLTELMGGRIGVISKEGRGSTFWFTAVFQKYGLDIKDEQIISGQKKQEPMSLADNNKLKKIEDDNSLIDYERAIECMMGDEKYLRMLLDEFIKDELPLLINSLNDAIEKEDGEALSKDANKLKGSSELFCANRIASVARQLEQKGKDKNFIEAKEIFQRLKIEKKSLEQHIISTAIK